MVLLMDDQHFSSDESIKKMIIDDFEDRQMVKGLKDDKNHLNGELNDLKMSW